MPYMDDNFVGVPDTEFGANGIPPIQPSHRGVIWSVLDCQYIIELGLRGTLNHLPRPPFGRERKDLAKHRNVLLFEKNASGFHVFVDGLHWSEPINENPGPFKVRRLIPENPDIRRTLLKITYFAEIRGNTHHVVAYRWDDPFAPNNPDRPVESFRFDKISVRRELVDALSNTPSEPYLGPDSEDRPVEDDQPIEAL